MKERSIKVPRQLNANVFAFEILGTHEGPNDNPIPKLKMTGRQHWTDKAQRYVMWKGHVVTAFMECLGREDRWIAEQNISLCGKPLVIPGEKGKMSIVSFWKDNKHADPENVFGSIADALFFNDKKLACVSDFFPTPTGHGLVKVEIEL
jgi:hypothetical protein